MAPGTAPTLTRRVSGRCTLQQASFVGRLCTTCAVLVGTLQSIIGIVVQTLSLMGINDYSSPLGPWLSLWLAIGNLTVAVPVFFGLVSILFFEESCSTIELVATSTISLIDLGVVLFMLYAFRQSISAIVYLITAAILNICLLHISVRGYRLKRFYEKNQNTLTTASILSESPLEVGSTSTIVGSEAVTSNMEELLQKYDALEENVAESVSDAVRSIVAQNQNSRCFTHSPVARIATLFSFLVIVLILHGFICSQAYFLVSFPTDPSTDRKVALYSYLNSSAQTERYVTSINLRVIEQDNIMHNKIGYNCITMIVHDQGQDSTSLLPLARSLFSIDPTTCLYALVDRPGHGLSDAGKQHMDLVTEAQLLNNLALLLIVESYSDLATMCNLPRRYNTVLKHFQLVDARRIEDCLLANNKTADDLAKQMNIKCIGHGSGAAVCLAWAKLLARLPSTLILPLSDVYGIDYYPRPLLLDSLLNSNVETTTVLNDEEAKLNIVKICAAPLGLANLFFGGKRIDKTLTGIFHLSDGALSVSESELQRFNNRINLCTFSEGYASIFHEEASYFLQAINLSEFEALGLPQPLTTLHLLVLSASACTRGPSAFNCGLFDSTEERVKTLNSVTNVILTELSTGHVEYYSSNPDDLWRLPQEIARWLIGKSQQANLIE